MFDEIRQKIHKAYLKNSETYNLRKRPIQYQEGERAWKRNYVLSKASEDFAAKLAPKFISCIVNKVLSPLVYNLKDEDGADLGNWHVKDLKKHAD